MKTLILTNNDMEMENINIYYMTEKQLKKEITTLARYIDGLYYKAIIVKKDNIRFIVVLN
jgi:hypothetical protein